MSKSQSKSLLAVMFAAVLLFAACGGSSDSTATTASTPDQKAKAGSGGGGLLSSLTGKTEPIVVPEGTSLNVRLEQVLASDSNKSGDGFSATVYDPVVVNGKTVIPKGATVKGTVVEAGESGRLKGRSILSLTLNQVEVDGKNYDLKTGRFTVEGAAHTKRNATMIGGGAGVGAAIGAIAGGGKGAAIGAGIGAGAGTAGAAATGKKEVKLSTESALKFKLSEAVTIQVKSK